MVVRPSGYHLYHRNNNPNRDSVPVQLPFERREYRDSSYFAIVSGIALGDCHPTLNTSKHTDVLSRSRK